MISPKDKTNPPSAGFSLLKPDTTNPRFGKGQTSSFQLPRFYPDGTEIGAPRLALSEAERLRLVEGSKSPTREKTAKNTNFRCLCNRAPAHCRCSRHWNDELEGLAKQIDTSRVHRQAKEARRAKLVAENMAQYEAATGELPPFEIKPASIEGVASYSDREYEPVDLSRVDWDTGEIAQEYKQRHGFTVISHREWSGEYRVRTQVEQAHGLPPEQSGRRVTESLTMDGARKIAESCQFMATKYRGYRTFFTMTLDTEARSRVELREAEGPFSEVEFKKNRYYAKGFARVGCKNVMRDTNGPVPEHLLAERFTEERAAYTPVAFVIDRYFALATGEEGDDVTYSTIQKELGRFFDACKKMRHRGWQYTNDAGEVVKVPPTQVMDIRGYLGDKKIDLVRSGDFYCWVVENPLNEHGKPNPHVHILTDWRVPYRHFDAWAARLESIWGNGMANLQKIKKPAAAGAYMAKAAGYMSKSTDGGQGEVRGNRYAISRDARAPDWVCIDRKDLGVMGHLIRDVHDYFTALYGNEFSERKQLNSKLEKTDKSEKRRRQQIGRRLEQVRDKLAELPAVASKYQITLRSKAAFRQFMGWALLEQDIDKPMFGWLPPKPGVAAFGEGRERSGVWYKQFLLNLHHNKAKRRWWGLSEAFRDAYAHECNNLQNEEREGVTLSCWREYMSMAC